MKINSRIFLLAVLFALPGCASSPTVPMTPPRPLTRTEWTGTWLTNYRSFYGYDSPQALVLRPDGTGMFVTSALFGPRKKVSHWVTRSQLAWQPVSPDEVSITFLTPEQTVSGEGVGGRGRRTGPFPVKSTQNGLRVNMLIYGRVAFTQADSQPDDQIAEKIAAETRQRDEAISAAKFGSGARFANQGNQDAGLFLAGAGLGASAVGNNALGQQLMTQAVTTYTGQVQPVNKIGNYDPNTYFVKGKGRATETRGTPSGTDAQMREAYPDGQAWDVQFLNGSVWKIYYGANTAAKNRALEQGRAVSGPGIAVKNRVLSNSPYKPHSGMKIGMEAINPPTH